ncbi:universal stress protein [Mucilaginibacter sp. 21P]|uniref:universal stress protein n=1 Tax=Mucilaginibacter sp. 21P TaxID=2778902 RepID=UPI001C58F990|nr:universal stress protein [Mucilaginibacter sp. 21P]QXV64923.1 universal stress protein [Mucilaginibacter sp. 21P]
MKTYLVPVDFSEAAFNAADFAARLSNQTNVERIILLNAYYISPYEELLPNADMVMLREQEILESLDERHANLNKLKHKLEKLVRAGVQIDVWVNRSHLVRAVVDRVEAYNADLVIIGSVGNSSAEGEGLGSHVIGISKASPVPVMVIPPAFKYRKVERAIIACDFKKVKENVPVDVLHKLLGKQNFELLVVNIDADNKHDSNDAEQLAEETTLKGMLQTYKPTYHFINSPDVIKGLLNFAEEKHAEIVIALPHKYSFFRSIIHSSISQQLASSSPVPVLLLK